MALFLRQDEQRSEVQQRVATELQERLKNASIESDEIEPAFLENQHTTRKAGMIIIILLAFLFIAFVVFLIRIS